MKQQPDLGAASHAFVNFISAADRTLWLEDLKQELSDDRALESLIRDPTNILSFAKLTQLWVATLHIAEAKVLEDRARHLAIEFLIIILELKPSFRQSLGKMLFPVLIKILLSDVAGSGDEGSNFRAAQKFLDRLANALGPSAWVPDLLLPYFHSESLSDQYVACIVLAQIAEGCSKVMIENLEQVVDMLLDSFECSWGRYRCAHNDAVAQLSIDLGPHLQAQYHHRIFPQLILDLDYPKPIRVQGHAATAVYYFSKYCTPEILVPYLDEAVRKLLALLKAPDQMVQESALTALASLANSSKEHFNEYYDAVMPRLIAIFLNANDKSNQMLRAKSIESISIVGRAVGKAKFRDDAKQVMKILVCLQRSQLDNDDPTRGYILQAWARFCKCLGQDFLPYMRVVMPPLLRSASLGDYSTGTGDIAISVLEEKATACNMLCCYADELKEGFFPWIDQAFQTLRPLLDYFHENVRRAAVTAMPELLRSAALTVKNEIGIGCYEPYLKGLTGRIVTALVEACHEESDTEISAEKLSALNECMLISGHHLGECIVRGIVKAIKKFMTDREERAKADDFDAEDGELLKRENEQEDKLFNKICVILDNMTRMYMGSFFLTFFDDLSPHLTQIAGKDKTHEERLLALCTFDYVAEECQVEAVKHYEAYLPLLLAACKDEYPDVRQAAAYGIGVCAEYGGDVFKPFVGDAVLNLKEAMKNPNFHVPEDVMAYDNAVSALGKICEFHRDSIDSAKVVPEWLYCLPLRGDDVMEAKIAHERLCRMVERNDSDLLGLKYEYLPKIFSVFAEVVGAGERLATVETSKKMRKLGRKLKDKRPGSNLAST